MRAPNRARSLAMTLDSFRQTDPHGQADPRWQDPELQADGERLVEQALAASGYLVSRNAPYAGGHVASAYGRPAEGVHVLQIEINRRLYLDEKRIARTDGFDRLRRNLQKLVADLAHMPPAALRPAQAAE